MTDDLNKKSEETKEAARGFVSKLIELIKDIFDVKR